jgi:hypothetical protein
MATKRFTDAEKWKDPFFENLSNDFKIIWLYLLDDCDNAGVWRKSMRRLNFHCNTSITEQDLLTIFKERLQPLTEDIYFIPKFMSFQYGSNWETSNNKAVVSAREKLESLGVSLPYQYPIDTLSKSLEYPIDTGKDKDKEKEEDKSKDKLKDKEYEEDMHEYMDEVFEEHRQKDEEFRKDMNGYMDKRFYDDKETRNWNTEVSEEQFNKLFKNV